MDEKEMECCPFCGCASLTTVTEAPSCSADGTLLLWWYVSCDGCMAQGPLEKTKEEAEAAWNRRW